MTTSYRVAKELIARISQKEIRVISAPVSIRQVRHIAAEAGLHERLDSKAKKFIMRMMDVKFQSAIWRHKDLLQHLIDCAMACQEHVFECLKDKVKHESDCQMCDAAKRTATNCFLLAKELTNQIAVSPNQVMRCAEVCLLCVNVLQSDQTPSSERCKETCTVCRESCMRLYQKIAVN